MDNTTNTTNQPTCQHCDHEVQYGQTEHGFKGFIHLATGTTVCPTEETGK